MSIITVGVLGRLEGLFDSMETIERYINELAEFAARYLSVTSRSSDGK